MKKRRIVLDVSEEFKRRVFRYAWANGVSATSVIKLAVNQFMRQNPVYKEAEYGTGTDRT